MTQKDLDFIKDAFSQIIDDIGGNPDWYEAARVVASDLGTLERELKEKVIELPSNLDEAAEKYSNVPYNFGEFAEIEYEFGEPIETIVDDKAFVKDAFKSGAEWMAGQGVSLSHLIAWYIQSVDAHEPVWTKEHLEELVKDYILIPKN